MKTVVVYNSKTGHSRKIARAVADALGIEAIDSKSDPMVENVDTLFIVGGIYGGKSNPALVDFASRLDSSTVRKVALITSCASRKFFQTEVRSTLVTRGIDVVTEEVVCWGGFLFSGWGHPNQEDFQSAIEFAKRHV